MFTYGNICEEIQDVKRAPMTSQNAAVLANLLYLKRHWPKETLDRQTLLDWADGMENADGTTGAHFTMEETELARAALAPECEGDVFYTTMNMMYSDYCEAARTSGVTCNAFYGAMAAAFLEDKDAAHKGAEKLARYYEDVAR